MKIYINNNTPFNLDNLKYRHKSLENLEIKNFETNLDHLVASDLDNIYCDLVKQETINFYLRSPQQIGFLAKQIAQDFNSNSSTLRLSLSELLMNSLEHGNLKIDSNTKNEMILAGNYYDLIEHLVESNNAKYIEVEYKLDSPKCITIKDQGDGFHYQEYLEKTDIEEMTYSGRGIQIASVELPKNNARFEYFDQGTKLIISFE